MCKFTLKVVILTFLCCLASLNHAHLVKHVLEHADKTVSGLANVLSGGLLGGFKLNINAEVNSKAERPPIPNYDHHDRPQNRPYGNFDNNVNGGYNNNYPPNHPNSQHSTGPNSQNSNSYSYAYANSESFSYSGNDVRPGNIPQHPGNNYNPYVNGHGQNPNGGYGNHGFGNGYGGFGNGHGGYGIPDGGFRDEQSPSSKKPSNPGYGLNLHQNGYGQADVDQNTNSYGNPEKHNDQSNHYDSNGNFASHNTDCNHGQNKHEYSKYPQNSHDTTITPKTEIKGSDDNPFYIPLGFDDSNPNKNVAGEKVDINIPDKDKVKRNEDKDDDDGEFDIDVRSKFRK